MDAIFSRRSIRRYTADKIDESVLETILEAAMAAPSAGDERPWHFVVIDDRAVLDEIPSFHPHAGMLREAPAAILVCGDETLEQFAGYWPQDCSAATQNILLAVESLGLGGVWLGIYPIEERVEGMRRLVGAPGRAIPFALVALGHPAESKPPARRFDPGRVHRNRWND